MRESRSANNDRGYAAIAWWLIPLGLLIALIIVLFGSEKPDIDAELTVTPLSAQMERVTIGERVIPGVPNSRLASGYIPPDQSLKDRVLQRLREFQVDFRQSAPAITVVAVPASEERQQLAAELTKLFAQARLGGTQQTNAPPAVIDQSRADIVLHVRQSDRDIAHQLLVALSPYLQGSFLLVFNAQNNLDSLLMVVQRTPQFRGDGQVLLWRNTSLATDSDNT
tara:strand:- start:3237 stop:3908 length:672 start_codon:yes stop_codon:yes gene_type:complete